MMYCEKVSAKPDSGRDMIQTRVPSQKGSALVTMSLHDALGDDGIGLGENGAAGEQLASAAGGRRAVRSSAGQPWQCPL